MSRQRGQTLAGLALCLPLVLLPVAAYAIESTRLAARASALQAAVAQAAEDAASAVDVSALRNGQALRLGAPQYSIYVFSAAPIEFIQVRPVCHQAATSCIRSRLRNNWQLQAVRYAHHCFNMTLQDGIVYDCHERCTPVGR